MRSDLSLTFGAETTSFKKTLTGWLKKLAIVTGIFSAGFGTGRYTYSPPPPSVARIIDGDTFVLTNDKEIRVFGIDAPEKGQPFYEAAQARLRQLVNGKTPGQDLEVTSKSSSFGRQVAIIEVNDKDIGASMVKEGLAFSELKYGKDKYRAEENEAIKAKRGVWTLPNGGERPWDFRAKKGKDVRHKDLKDRKVSFMAVPPEFQPLAVFQRGPKEELAFAESCHSDFSSPELFQTVIERVSLRPTRPSIFRI